MAFGATYEAATALTLADGTAEGVTALAGTTRGGRESRGNYRGSSQVSVTFFQASHADGDVAPVFGRSGSCITMPGITKVLLAGRGVKGFSGPSGTGGSRPSRTDTLLGTRGDGRGSTIRPMAFKISEGIGSQVTACVCPCLPRRRGSGIRGVKVLYTYAASMTIRRGLRSGIRMLRLLRGRRGRAWGLGAGASTAAGYVPFISKGEGNGLRPAIFADSTFKAVRGISAISYEASGLI